MTMMGVDAILAAHGLAGGGYRAGQKIHVSKLGLYNPNALLKVDDFLNGQWAVMACRHKNGYVYTIESVSGMGQVVRKYAESNLKSPIWSYTLSTSYVTSPGSSTAIDVSDNGSYIAATIGGTAVVLNADGSVNRSFSVSTGNVYCFAACNNGDVWYTEQSSTTYFLYKVASGSTTVTQINGSSTQYEAIIADETNQCLYIGNATNNNIYKLAMSISSTTTPSVFATLGTSVLARCFAITSTSLYVGASGGWVYKFTTATGAQVWSTQTIKVANGWSQDNVSVGIGTTGSPGLGLEQNETGLWLTDLKGIGKIACVDGSNQGVTIASLTDYVVGNTYTGIMPIQQSDGKYNIAIAISNASTNNPNPSRQPILSEWVKVLP